MKNRSCRTSIWALMLLGAWEAVAWSHVSDTKLQEALDSSAYTLVAFVMPSHDASKALEPEWLSLEKTEKDENIVSLDCAAQPKFCRDLDVLSYPAIRLYHRDGRMNRYRGERKARDIGTFLHRVLHPAILPANEHTLGTMTLLDDIVIVGHIHPDDDDLYDRFTRLAKQYHDRYSFIMSSAPAADQPKSAQTSLLACYSNLDDTKFTTSETATVHALDEFIKLCAEPLIPELTRRNEGHYAQTGKSILHYFTATTDSKDRFRDEMRPLAKKYAEFLHVAITDSAEYPDMPAMVGLKPGTKTGMALENTNTGEMFPYTKGAKTISAKSVEDFLDRIIDGKVKPWSGGRDGRGHEEL
ncbi:protein disulfide-isomerase [Bombardia bombarda]|uniref:Protein disulfide-isomerase n=1 Tax=Bombardia bombarda TaxID=252184 RepID=A0AA39U5E2_9PEZI|nr:protein disulfide-isomerase [Bombardia bombarda]